VRSKRPPSSSIHLVTPHPISRPQDVAETAVDVAIVGAGVAGLRLASLLEDAAFTIVLLEARDRVGGRVYTLHDPLSPVPLELGAEFVHGRPPELWRHIEAGRLRAVKVEGDNIYRSSGEASEAADAIETADRLLSEAAPQMDEPFRRFLERTQLSPAAKRAVAGYIEGFNAASLDSIGVLGLVRQQRAEHDIDGGQVFRIVDGYDAVPLLLLRSLREPGVLRLNTVVERIEWRRGWVRIRARSLGTDLAVSARFCAITAPLGVLQSGAIQFDPDPPAVRRAIHQLAMGDAVRVTLRFRRPFWEDRPELKNVSFLHAPDEEFPTWWTQAPVRVPVVTAWTGGPTAAKFALCGPEAVISTALDCMSRAFQTDRRALADELAAWRYHDWRNDPFSRGAYSYVPAGALDAIEALTRPVDGSLFFAGEASDPDGHWGTVHGAMRSAERAAAQIRAAAGR